MLAKMAAPLSGVGFLLCMVCQAQAVPTEEQAKERAALLKQALALRAQGKLAEAIIPAEKIVALDRDTNNDMNEPALAALQILGHLFWKTRRLEDAQDCLRKVHERAPTVLGREHDGYLWNMTDLGNLEKEMGLLERADSLLRGAYSARLKSGKRDDGLKYAARSLGLHYLHKRELERAEPLLKQALALSAELKGKINADYANHLNDLAMLYSDMRQFKKAIALQEEALQVTRASAGEASPSYAVMVLNLGVIYHHTGDLSQARRFTQQSLEIVKRLFGEDHPSCAGQYLSLGQLSYALGDYDDAEKVLRHALALRVKAQQLGSREHILTLRALADVYMARDRPADALDWQRQVIEAEQQRVRHVFSFSTEAGMFAYLGSIAGSQEALLAMTLSRQTADPSVATNALTWTLRRKGIIVETLAQYRAQEQTVTGDPNVAPAVRDVQSLRKQLAIAETAAAASDDPELERKRRSLAELLYQRERFLHTKLSAYRKKQTQPFHEVEAEQVRRKLPADAALVEIVRARVPNFKAKGSEPHWGSEHYLAFVLTTDAAAPARLFHLGTAQAIDGAIRDFREKIERAPRELRASDEKTLEEDFRVVGSALYKLVFAPLRPALGKAKMIYVAPDGELNRVPFQALVDPDEKYLIESYRFAYVMTGRDLLSPRVVPGARPVKPSPGLPMPRAPEPGKGTIIFAAPDYDLKPDQREARAQELLKKGGMSLAAVTRGAAVDTRGLRWQPLAGAAAEAEDLKKVLQGSRFLPVRTYQGADALEEVFKAIPAPRVLHVATHGFFLPDEKSSADGDAPGDARGAGSAGALAGLKKTRNPLLRSGIVLAGANTAVGDTAAVEDGLVTAEEIALMNLRGTELVVLSACESGLGNIRIGEGVYGLRHAFLHAGARTLVTSLFEVPDVETRELMRRFYEGLNDRTGKLQALHEAQLGLLRERRQKKEAAHPFFWASFVLIGDPN